MSNYQVIINNLNRYMYHLPEAAALIVFYLKKPMDLCAFLGSH